MRAGILAGVLALFAAAGPASAATDVHLPEREWSFEGPMGSFDQAALQRGFQVYREVCSSCHGMKFLYYRNLGQEGGPLAAYQVQDAKSGESEVRIGPGEHGGRLIDPNDNPYVKALAAEYTISELDNSTGDLVDRPARPSDRFWSPFPNEAAAKAANGGVAPPDLSVIAKARHGGADYLTALLLGYEDQPPEGVEPVPGKYYNKYFHGGGFIGMPPPLVPDRVSYADGTAATVEQMAADVSTFLTWAAEPKVMKRKELGLAVMVYLAVLTALLYLAYKQVWKGVKH